jgi:putative peptidoglycan lipid II flippase
VQSERVARSAGVMSVAVLASRLTGVARERVMAGLFGASMEYDSFLLGFRIPNLTRDLFAEGALSSAFVPVFTEYLATKSKKEAAELANLVATAIIIVVGSFCALGILFSPLVVRWLAPGFLGVPGKFDLAVTMTRIMFPFLLLVALAAQVMGILNACHRFFLPALASAFFNVGSIVMGLILGYWVGPLFGMSMVNSMAWGVVFGGALQLSVQAPLLWRDGFFFRFRIDWSHPGLRRIAGLMAPAILGNAAVQVNVMVNTYFASQIHDPLRGLDGPVSWLNCAFRFMQLPLGLFGVAIGSATLPSITRSAVAGNMEEFRRTLSRSLGMVFLLTVPSSVGLIVLGQPMIGAIYQTGKFKLYDTQQTAMALSCYAVGLAGYAALKVLTPSFYTLHDARTPMYVSLSSIVINFAVSWLMITYTQFGHAGLALSTSVVALVNFVVLFAILRGRIGGIHGRSLFSNFVKVCVGSATMGLVVFFTNRFMISMVGSGLRGRLLDLLVSICLGLAVFYGVCRFLKVDALDLALRAAAGPLGRMLPARRDRIQ